MLRKFAYNKIFRTTGMLFLFILLLLFPVSKEYSLEDAQNTKYVSKSQLQSEVYLLDKNDYVSRCIVPLKFEKEEKSLIKLVELLIENGKYEEKIPNGFRSILPSDTTINSLKIENDSVILDISNDILELDDKKVEKIIELITYNLTNIKDIKYVYLNLNGKLLSKYPKSHNIINQPFSRDDGVNKDYEEFKYSDVSKTTIYYVGKSNSNYYYIPVTKINNDSRDKIKIIVDELTSNSTYDTNLMSFLNYNTKLNSYNIENNTLTIDFNEFIFDDIETKSILEEVIYTISLSVRENYDVENVIFTVDGKEITKSVLKHIE